MNYEANITPWKHGNIVIHDADAKEPRMLMKVVCIQRDGRYRTQYIDKRHKRTMWVNDMASLHDPAHFGIDVTSLWQEELERYQHEFELARRWNCRHRGIGVVITRTSMTGEEIPINHTTTFAYMEGHRAFVNLAYGGKWLLRFLNIAPGPDDIDPATGFIEP